MGFERDILDYWRRRRSQDDHAGWFAPGVRRALAEDPDASALVHELESSGRVAARDGVLLTLRGLELLAAEQEPDMVDVQLVATLPPGFVVKAMPTGQAIGEMLEGARQEVVALGYEISEARFLERLHAAAGRLVGITLICDRGRDSARAILENWPEGIQRPRIYEDAPREDAGPYASMHSKCILVDGQDLLLTSANLTFHGLHENLEFGVRIRGRVAEEARRLITEMLRSGDSRTV